MTNLKYLFIFDTNFFRSLIALGNLAVVEHINEIFTPYNEIKYLALTIVLSELSKFRNEKRYLHQHIRFTQITPNKKDLKKLKMLNTKTGLFYIDKYETMDYIFIQTALDYAKKSEFVFIVSDDEGIHSFVEFIIGKENIRVIWNYDFLNFLAGRTCEELKKSEIQKIGGKQKEYIEKYRRERERRTTENLSKDVLKALGVE